MDPGTITLDREAFKALASEVRVEVLRQLEARRMTVTDLSNVMHLAKPTLLEHLDRLVTAGLVTKVDEGRKWIYYELTKRGRNILHPHQVKIMISLAVSILLVGAGVIAILTAATGNVGLVGGPAETGTGWTAGDRSFGEAVAMGEPIPWGILAIGLAVVPLVAAIWYRRAGRELIDSVRTELGAA